jgi:hypothetical protein
VNDHTNAAPPRLADLVAQLDEADADLVAAGDAADDAWHTYELAVERAARARARYDLAVARYEAERRHAR